MQSALLVSLAALPSYHSLLASYKSLKVCGHDKMNKGFREEYYTNLLNSPRSNPEPLVDAVVMGEANEHLPPKWPGNHPEKLLISGHQLEKPKSAMLVKTQDESLCLPYGSTEHINVRHSQRSLAGSVRSLNSEISSSGTSVSFDKVSVREYPRSCESGTSSRSR